MASPNHGLTPNQKNARQQKKRAPAPIALPRAQYISPVFGKVFDAPLTHKTFLTNLHRSHRGLMDQLARELGLEVEYREDAKKSNGKPNPNAYALHILSPEYEREELLSELHARIISAWSEKQNQSDAA